MLDADNLRLPRSLLFVVPRFHTNLAVAVRALDRAGCKVHVFSPGEGTIEDHSVVTPRLIPASASRREVWASVRAINPDLIFIRACKPLSRQVGYFARIFGVRSYSYGLSPVTKRPEWGRQIERLLHGQPRRRITPVPGLSPTGAADKQAIYLPWPVEATMNPKARAAPHQVPLRILCVGKLHQPRKNQDKLVSALDGLNRPSEMQLTLVGSASQRASGGSLQHWESLAARAAETGGRMRVEIRADVPYSEMPGIYAQHDICVLPADREPLGMAPLEAMAYGLVPVFSTQCGSAGCVTDGQDGFVIDANHPPAMQALFSRLLDDREIVARVGSAARETAEGPLGPDAFLRRISALYTGSNNELTSTRTTGDPDERTLVGTRH
ncbi:MAG: glycosyltransferase family 4 protein [Pseudomonadota bacterium]